MKFSRLLFAGLVISLAAHAAGSAYFAPDPDEVEIAASEGGAVSVVGSLEDLIAGTDVPLEAVEEPVEELEPIEDPVEIAAVQPVQQVEAITPDTVQPVVQGVTDIKPVTAETVPELKQVEPQEVKPVEVETVEPEVMQPVETVTATPTKKPEPVREKIRPRKQKQQRGADRNTRKGGEYVTDPAGRSNANGRQGATSQDGGTKARSNYNGKVLAKLRRAKRYPAEARRERLNGTVTVRFTVAQSGAVSGVGIARSSGHRILDQAALDMVRRASPMPPIPPEVGRSKLSFTVPVRFSR